MLETTGPYGPEGALTKITIVPHYVALQKALNPQITDEEINNKILDLPEIVSKVKAAVDIGFDETLAKESVIKTLFPESV
jgi:hypothetical protein